MDVSWGYERCPPFEEGQLVAQRPGSDAQDAAQEALTLAHNLRDASQQCQWADAESAAAALASAARAASEATLDAEGVGGAGDAGGLLWRAASAARAGLLKLLVAFAGRASRGPPEDLCLAVAAACTALLPDVWPSSPAAADDLLGMAGVVRSLLRVAATPSKTGEDCTGGFAVLSARRAAAELLTALLEASNTAWRQPAEASLLKEQAHTGAMQALADALLGCEPDPRLHESLLELLWRGLRRLPSGAGLSALAAAHPALLLLEARQAGLCARLQSLAPDQLLADARGLALELCFPGAEPAVFGCRSSAGDWAGSDGAIAVFSRHCLGLHHAGEMEPTMELPWEVTSVLDLQRAPEASSAFGDGGGESVLMALSVDLEALWRLGCLPDVAVPPTFELLVDGPLAEVLAALPQRQQQQLPPQPYSAPEEGQPEWMPTPQNAARLQLHGIMEMSLVGGLTVLGPDGPEPLCDQAAAAHPLIPGRAIATPCRRTAPTDMSPALYSVVSVSSEASPSRAFRSDNNNKKSAVTAAAQPQPPWRAAAAAAKRPPGFDPKQHQEVQQQQPLVQNKPMLPQKLPVEVSRKLAPAVAKANGSSTNPAAAQLLSRLFGGGGTDSSRGGGNQPGPGGTRSGGSRGYAVLATSTLQALCKARGLPAAGERAELLAKLEGAPVQPTSAAAATTASRTTRRQAQQSQKQPLQAQKQPPFGAQQAEKAQQPPPQSRQSKRLSEALQPPPKGLLPEAASSIATAATEGWISEKFVAAAVAAQGCTSRSHQPVSVPKISGFVVDGQLSQKVAQPFRRVPPQDAVTRVLQEAARLAREVAEVQRQFRESKKATEVRSSEADAMLDQIAKAGSGLLKRSREDAWQCFVDFAFQADFRGDEKENVAVAVGKDHALMLTDEGVLYSWGASNDFGQLGRPAANEAKMMEPSPIINGIKSEILVQIACGANHCLALSQRGMLFAWGSNKAGQLGIEGFSTTCPVEELIEKTPTPVKGFSGQDGSKFARSCSCGPESSACVSTAGEVYVWGAISYYAFGNGTQYNRGENCTVPVCIRGVPHEVCTREDSGPDQVALYKDTFATTIARKSVEEEMGSLITSLKTRSSQ
ncbi:unnamed protein product, partial [Polarella glacialis]